LEDAEQLRELSGELGANFKQLSKSLEVQILQRGSQVVVVGEEDRVHCAVTVVKDLYHLAGRGLHIQESLVDQACRLALGKPAARITDYFEETVFVGRRKTPIFPRTLNQLRYVKAMMEHDVVIGVGPAGTGKTYLAMAMAVSALVRGEVSRIVLCRPAVEAGEKLGYLPGDLAEKVNPYLRPLYDALYDMVDENRVERLIDRRVVEVAPLAFMRGRTLSDAYILLDEAQNTTVEQMQMFLTRLGNNSKAVVNGDITQVDLPRGRVSGLVHARRVLAPIKRIAQVEFGSGDVVRHSLVSAIIEAYQNEGRAPRGREE
jgi:phosphate starvation-inducible PhoH-like protein